MNVVDSRVVASGGRARYEHDAGKLFGLYDYDRSGFISLEEIDEKAAQAFWAGKKAEKQKTDNVRREAGAERQRSTQDAGSPKADSPKADAGNAPANACATHQLKAHQHRHAR